MSPPKIPSEQGICGEGGSRTLDTLRYASFPTMCTRPLCDLSVLAFVAFHRHFCNLEYNTHKDSTSRSREEKMEKKPYWEESQKPIGPPEEMPQAIILRPTRRLIRRCGEGPFSVLRKGQKTVILLLKPINHGPQRAHFRCDEVEFV